MSSLLFPLFLVSALAGSLLLISIYHGLKRRFIRWRKDRRADGLHDAAMALHRGFTWPKTQRLKLPRRDGFADEGLLRCLVEFAVILALMLALVSFFAAFDAPRW
jgi:hypothetical protein